MLACARCGHSHDDVLGDEGPLCLPCAADVELPAPRQPDLLAASVVLTVGCGASWGLAAFAAFGVLPEMFGEAMLWAGTMMLVGGIVVGSTGVRAALGRISGRQGVALLAIGLATIVVELPLVAWVWLTQSWSMVSF